MKKIILSLLAVLGLISSYAQNGDYKKRSAFGVHFTLTDFKTAADIRSSGLASVLRKGDYKKIVNMSPGLAVSYWKGLSNYVDFFTLANFTFVNYPIPNKPVSANDKFALSWDANLAFKAFPDKYWVSPYLTAGVGATQYAGNYSGYVPLGLGLQVNLWDDAFLMINSQYRVPVTSLGAYHVFHGFGFVGSIGTKKEKPVVVALPPPPPDTDNDGIVDSVDACPTVPGIAAFNGCPDTDKDGIADKDDACPTVAGLAAFNGCPDSDNDGIADKDDACPTQPGLAKYKGCPIPDSDGDGINDEEDKCPNQSGLARYQGCPIPDSDGDGVNDEEDKCPTVVGVAENFGCPKVDENIVKKLEYAAKNVYFAPGKFTLLAKSNAGLNEVVKIMKSNPELNLEINGHTDNTGDAAKNQTLSERRAQAVKDYLVKKGVEEARIISAGYGQDQPIADNATAAGRAKNRRVEIKVRNY